TRLVVVLGHTRCGAILATLEDLARPGPSPSRNLTSIVGRIRPSVEPLLEGRLREDPEALVKAAGRANIRASVDHLRHGSELRGELMEARGLGVVGAEYCLEPGVVEFLDERS